jgi:hypothetical protein
VRMLRPARSMDRRQVFGRELTVYLEEDVRAAFSRQGRDRVSWGGLWFPVEVSLVDDFAGQRAFLSVNLVTGKKVYRS